jgi:hypothetical protein
MREITDREGRVWAAEVVSHGRTSDYLNPKVHRPIVEFTCRSASAARRYASLPPKVDGLESLGDEELIRLLGKAEVH